MISGYRPSPGRRAIYAECHGFYRRFLPASAERRFDFEVGAAAFISVAAMPAAREAAQARPTADIYAQAAVSGTGQPARRAHASRLFRAAARPPLSAQAAR